MFPMLQLGPISIPMPGLFILLGLWIGLSRSEKYSNNFGVPPSVIYNLTFLSIISGIITARLVYVARFPASFLAKPINLIIPNPAMLDLEGGLAGAFLAAFIYINRKRINIWHLLDALTPLFATASIAYALANFASGDAFGRPTNVPWAINLWTEMRHPVQIYEAIGAVIILIITSPRNRWVSLIKPGGLFFAYMSLASLVRLICETYRGDSILVLGQYRLIQIIALIILMLGLWAFRKTMPSPSNMNNPKQDPQ